MPFCPLSENRRLSVSYYFYDKINLGHVVYGGGLYLRIITYHNNCMREIIISDGK